MTNYEFILSQGILCKQKTSLYTETKIEEREGIDQREEKNEKEKRESGSGRHVSPLPNNQPTIACFSDVHILLVQNARL